MIEQYLEMIGYTGEYRYIIFAIDLILSLGLFTVLSIMLYKKLKRKTVFLVAASYFIVSTITTILDLQLVKLALITTLAIVCVGALVIGNFEQKNGAKPHQQQTTNKENKNFVSNQDAKAALIETLVTTVEYLSSRKIGAIITIEKENSLNLYINKAVIIDAEVSCELLKTIFFPNTALHDGAVIIRGNRIMCAGVYYNHLADKEGLGELGTRHRAAIGISEETDAFTLVVSEQTGIISTTIGGTITRELNDQELRVSLNQHIIVQ